MKRILSLVFSLLIAIITPRFHEVYAFYDPRSVPNNQYGIHITNEADIIDAGSLVNSKGGDWGYVTVVITQPERSHDRWQKFFDSLRRQHLIPIVRIASSAQGDTWQIPSSSDIDSWVSFLNSLNWVTENRYVIIGNEPNHAKEWGGKIDPTGYAEYLVTFSEKLKESSPDFFVITGGLDASAKNTADTIDESQFLRQMLKSQPNLFDKIDGFSSHSYPNPDFAGSAGDSGRGSVRTYQWEKALLKSLGVQKDLPIFITETGWSSETLTDSQISLQLKEAYQSAWNDSSVVAVTPFILNYPDSLFAKFSWKKNVTSFHQFYYDVQQLSKVAGKPRQIESGEIVLAFIQPIAVVANDFFGIILVRNTGQSIWNQENVAIGNRNMETFVKSYSFTDLEPMHLGLIVFRAYSSGSPGVYLNNLFLTGANGSKITNTFPIELLILKLDKMQLQANFDRILESFKPFLKFQGP